MDEFDLIKRYFDRPPRRDGRVLAGIGDDGALLQPAPGQILIDVVDTVIEEVHFPATLPAADVGYRAVAVNLSDVAAMAGEPRWMTLALTLRRADPDWLERFADGLFEAADQFDVALVGGDTTSGPATVISVQIVGEVEERRALRRRGAAAGDAVFVSGTTGDAAAGLKFLREGHPDSPRHRALVQRFARPAARIALGRSVASLASAAIDLSDGLVADLRKLADASGCAARLDLGRLPLSAEMRALFDADTARNLALSGGDDYELCFTAPPEHETGIQAVAEQLGVPVTRIGEMAAGTGIVCTEGGREVAVDDAGYRHFRGD